jgi:hypothetical protein
MTPADHMRLVHESKREFAGVLDQPNHRWVGVSRARVIPGLHPGPADPERLHVLHRSITDSGVCRGDKGMVNPKDL